jgi:activating signal cointegrator 1
MKAITLEQPFASLVCIGVKSIETRSWSTDYRGPLAIHAADISAQVVDSYYRSILFSAGLDPDKLPTGKIVAVAHLVDCKEVITAQIPCYPQLAFSNFTPGWYALEFADIRPLENPISAQGSNRLWDWIA